jgi:CheY-like chemotaxis protein
MSTDTQILIIDDDKDTAKCLCEYLMWEGFSCATVNDGVAALDFLEHNTVELMLLDLHMPTMSGETFLRLKEIDRGLRYIPVIVITAQRISDALPGVSRVFKKPIEMEELVTAIKRYCRVRPDR